MESFLAAAVAVVIIGGPVLAWVVRVEKKLTALCTTTAHIYKIIERRSGAVLRDIAVVPHNDSPEG